MSRFSSSQRISMTGFYFREGVVVLHNQDAVRDNDAHLSEGAYDAFDALTVAFSISQSTGYVLRLLGPTTAGQRDAYVDKLMKNRESLTTSAWKKYD